MSYNYNEKTYLTVGLIELFRDVKEYEKRFHLGGNHQNDSKSDPRVKWEVLTGYFIDNVIQGGFKKNVLPNKYISKHTVDKYQQVYGSKMLDEYTPEVIGGSQQCLRRFKQSQKYIDSYHHNQGIRCVEYIQELRNVLVLDNLADQLIFYDEHSNRVKSVKPKNENHIMDTGILYFAYSVQEKRIGACLQDYSLSFWDQSDNFTFEKTFSAQLDILQIFIKYVEYCTSWVTVDQLNVLNVWDIEKEQANSLPKRHEERITDVCELKHLKLLAACSLDKKIIFWDIVQRVPAYIMKLEGGISAHSMCYSQDFRILVTAQYENDISVWSFEGKDCSLLSRLKGHCSQITAIHVLKDTPLIISSDEIGFIKTWDIRTCECIQTYHFECKSSIHQFLNINDTKFVGVEYRLHWFEFEDKVLVNANGIEIANMAPINIKYNHIHNQLCVATKSDIRLIDILTGQTSKIIANIVQDEEGQKTADITQFQLTADGKRFIVGDNKGSIRTYVYETSSLETFNSGHAQEITEIRIDEKNNLIVSSGWDSSIVIQKIIGQKDYDHSINEDDGYDSEQDVLKSKIIRTVKNAHFGHEISAIQVSSRLSMIATASHGVIFLWDYETLKLIGCMTNNFNEILTLHFLDPFPLLCSLDINGVIIVWQQLKQKSYQFIMYKPLFTINLAYGKDKETISASKMYKDLRTEEDFSPYYTTNIDKQHSFIGKFQDQLKTLKCFKSLKSLNLILSDDSGNIYVLDISQQLLECGISKKSENLMLRKIFNPYRVVTCHTNGIFYKQQELIDEIAKREQFNSSNTMLTLLSSNIKQSFPNQQDQKQFFLNEILHYKFKAATETLVVLQIIKIPPKLIATSTNSRLVRLWTFFGECLCIFDIDQPLPYKWEIKISTYLQRKKKYMDAVNIINEIEGNSKKNEKIIDDNKTIDFANELIKLEVHKNETHNFQEEQRKSFVKNQLREQELLEQEQSMLEENENNKTLTFQRFLSTIDHEDKVLKNPKKFSLKIMEARKNKGYEFKHDLNNQNPLSQRSKEYMSQSNGLNAEINRQMQGQASNMTQISLLDKIESMVNMPKKLPEKTKLWEKALEQDIRTMKRLKKIEEEKSKIIENTSSQNNQILRKSTQRRGSLIEQQSDLQSIKSKSKKVMVKAASAAELQKNQVSNDIKFEPPEEQQNINDRSISSYRSGHLIAFFNDKNKNQKKQQIFKDKSRMDWMTYLQTKQDPLPQIYKESLNDQTLQLTTNMTPSVNQYVQAKRQRSILFKELDLKRKYYRKNFDSAREYQGKDDTQIQDDGTTFQLPQYIQDLSSNKMIITKQKDKSSPKSFINKTEDLQLKYEEELRDSETKLDLLNHSKDSILQTSSFYLKMAEKHPELVPKLVELWADKASTCNLKQKVAMVYLANDLIQRSKLQQMQLQTSSNETTQQQHLNFWKQFELVVDDVFVKIARQMYKVKKEREEIHRVIKVWKERQIYSNELIDSISSRIKEIEDKEKQAKRDRAQKEIQEANKKLKPQDFEGFQVDTEMQKLWVDLSEILAYQNELDEKLSKIEQELELQIANMKIVDEIELECKIDDYKQAHNQAVENRRLLLQFSSKAFAKVDNQFFQNFLLIQKFDDTYTKLKSLRDNFIV